MCAAKRARIETKVKTDIHDDTDVFEVLPQQFTAKTRNMFKEHTTNADTCIDTSELMSHNEWRVSVDDFLCAKFLSKIGCHTQFYFGDISRFVTADSEAFVQATIYADPSVLHKRRPKKLR